MSILRPLVAICGVMLFSSLAYSQDKKPNILIIWGDDIGVIHSYADGRIEDTGPLNKKRMETLDEETTAAALDFMERAVNADKPFFVWWNSTRMHIFTHLKPASVGKTGLGVYADGTINNEIGAHEDMLAARRVCILDRRW